MSTPDEGQQADLSDGQQSDVPRAGLEDFDFSAPDVAAQHAQQDDASLGTFAFGDQKNADQQEGGEVSISEEEANDAANAFSFPVDLISEPKRKVPFEKQQETASENAALGGVESDTLAIPEPAVEAGHAPVLDLGAEPAPAPAKAAEPQPKQASEPQPAGPVFTPPPRTGPVFTPPARQGAAAAPKTAEDDDIDLGAALAIPKGRPDRSGSDAAGDGDAGDVQASAPAASGEVHPLSSGNVTGAIAGFGCALPLVAFLLLGFGMVMRFAPILADMPFYHLVAVLGTGILSLGIMVGLVMSLVQAFVGRKLFFLLNILLGAVFGAMFGAGMSVITTLASGKALSLGGLLSDVMNWGGASLVASVIVVIVRAIMLSRKDETFAAPLSVAQKIGLGLSLAVILLSLYEQGTFAGRIEKAATAKMMQLKEEVTPDGLIVEGANAYRDPQNGDLIMTGTVRNTTDKPKPGWYLELEVYDGGRNVLGKVEMVNGVQIFSTKDYAGLARRGINVDELKGKMVVSVQSAVIPARGSVTFEAHLMEPPSAAAGFLPFLRKFDPLETFERLARGMEQQ